MLHDSKGQKLILNRQNSAEMESNVLIHPLFRVTAFSVPAVPQHISLVSPGESHCILTLTLVANGCPAVCAAVTCVHAAGGAARLSGRANACWFLIQKTSRWPKRRGGHVKLCLQLSLQEFSGPAKIGRVGGRDCCGSLEEG